jgi:hypothetical protein
LVVVLVSAFHNVVAVLNQTIVAAAVRAVTVVQGCAPLVASYRAHRTYHLNFLCFIS